MLTLAASKVNDKRRYPSKTFDDYRQIITEHLAQMVDILNRICQRLKKFSNIKVMMFNISINAQPHNVDISQENSVLDFVLIMAPDNPGETSHQEECIEIAAACDARGLQYRILGNGKAGITLDDIAKLPKAYNIVIAGHGSIRDDLQSIALDDDATTYLINVIEKVQEQTNAKNIIVSSCYGAKVIDDIKLASIFHGKRVLQEGTNLFIPAPNDDVCFMGENREIVNNFVKKIKPGQQTSLVSIVENAIKTIPESMVFAHQPEDENGEFLPLESHVIRRTDRLKYTEPKLFCEYLLDDFNCFIDRLVVANKAKMFIAELRNEFPHFEEYNQKLSTEDKVGLLPKKMTPEQIAAFQERSLCIYINHNDLKTMDALLASKQFCPRLLALAMKDKHSDVGVSHSSEDMVNLILKHGKNALYGQNVNAFAPDAFFDYFFGIYAYDDSLSPELAYSTPLTLALRAEDTGAVKALMDHGADIYLPDRRGVIPANKLADKKYQTLFATPMQKAINAVECGKMFLSGLSEQTLASYPILKEEIDAALLKITEFERVCDEEQDQSFRNGETHPPKNNRVFNAFKAFIAAANKLPTDILYKISAKESQFNITNAPNDAGITPLHLAVMDNVIDNVKFLLLAKDTHINAVSNNEQKSALHYVMSKIPFSLEIVQVLLVHGANPNIPDCEGRTALHYAAACNAPDAIEALLKAGANPDASDGKGLTPLHYAAANNAPNAIKTLVKAGATPDLLDSQGLTPLYLAAAKNAPDAIKTLLSTNVALDSSDYKCLVELLNMAAANNAPDAIEALLEAGANPRVLDSNGLASLHYAVVNGQVNAVKTFLTIGGNTNILDKEKRSPLHLAVLHNQHEVVKELLNSAADIYAVDSERNSLLHVAVTQGNIDVIETLLKAGANIFAKNSHGQLPKDLVSQDAKNPILLKLIAAETFPNQNNYTLISLVDFIQDTCWQLNKDGKHLQLNALNKIHQEITNDVIKFYPIDVDKYLEKISDTLGLNNYKNNPFSFFAPKVPFVDSFVKAKQKAQTSARISATEMGRLPGLTR